MARASSSRRSSTWVSSFGRHSALPASSTCSRHSRRARRWPRRAWPANSSGTRTFSSTDRLLKGCGSWKVRARPSRARRCGFSPSSAAPPSVTLPSCAAKSPVMQLTKVDLPEPLGPIRPSRSPARSSISTCPAGRRSRRSACRRPRPSAAPRRHRRVLNQPRMPRGASATKTHQHPADDAEVERRGDGHRRRLLHARRAAPRRSPARPRCRRRRSAAWRWRSPHRPG